MQLKAIGVSLSLLCLVPLSLLGQEPSPTPTGQPAPPAPGLKPAAGKPVYKPPMMGAPAVRVGGASRGDGVDASLMALVPDHAGLTTKAHPSLFWYQSKPAKARLELTLTEPKQVKPLLRLEAAAAKKEGIQRVRLGKYNAELAPGSSCKWSVALVSDAQNRSKDVVATGVITRVAESEELAKKLQAATPAERPFIYAEAGIWYDALEAISDLIEANPKEPAYRAQRAALLEQIGLKEIAGKL